MHDIYAMITALPESWWNLVNWDYANENLDDTNFSFSYDLSMEYFDYYH